MHFTPWQRVSKKKATLKCLTGSFQEMSCYNHVISYFMFIPGLSFFSFIFNIELWLCKYRNVTKTQLL